MFSSFSFSHFKRSAKAKTVFIVAGFVLVGGLSVAINHLNILNGLLASTGETPSNYSSVASAAQWAKQYSSSFGNIETVLPYVVEPNTIHPNYANHQEAAKKMLQDPLRYQHEAEWAMNGLLNTPDGQEVISQAKARDAGVARAIAITKTPLQQEQLMNSFYKPYPVGFTNFLLSSYYKLTGYDPAMPEIIQWLPTGKAMRIRILVPPGAYTVNASGASGNLQPLYAGGPCPTSGYLTKDENICKEQTDDIYCNRRDVMQCGNGLVSLNLLRLGVDANKVQIVTDKPTYRYIVVNNPSTFDSPVQINSWQLAMGIGNETLYNAWYDKYFLNGVEGVIQAIPEQINTTNTTFMLKSDDSFLIKDCFVVGTREKDFIFDTPSTDNTIIGKFSGVISGEEKIVVQCNSKTFDSNSIAKPATAMIILTNNVVSKSQPNIAAPQILDYTLPNGDFVSTDKINWEINSISSEAAFVQWSSPNWTNNTSKIFSSSNWTKLDMPISNGTWKYSLPASTFGEGPNIFLVRACTNETHCGNPVASSFRVK